MQLTKVNVLGEWFWHRWTDGTETETTADEYHALASGGAPTPPEGKTWQFSYAGPKYDTATGKLLDGQYADNVDNYAVVIDNFHTYVTKEKIVDDVLDDSFLPEIRELIELEKKF
jgi:hypothetical protein